MTSFGEDPHPVSTDPRGPWMQTSTGGKFFLSDPRPEEVFIMDIANGLAKEQRYGGQIDIDLDYSVAEHSVLMAKYAYESLKWGERACLCVLLHDAAEAYVKDIPSPLKHVLGSTYAVVEYYILDAILDKYDLLDDMDKAHDKIKELDRLILNTEKPHLFKHGVDWGYDQTQTMQGIELQCWRPSNAKHAFLIAFNNLTRLAKIAVNEETMV